jgi:hypothetical protein
MNNELAKNDDVKLDAIAHEQDWREKVDQDTFARVKYLVVTELMSATPFAQLFVTRHQMSCCWFLPFQWAHSWPFGGKEPPNNFVTSSQPRSTTPIVFHNYKDSVMRVAGILRVPTMCSRDILLQQAKKDHFYQVYSDQMVLEMIRVGGWSSRAVVSVSQESQN